MVNSIEPVGALLASAKDRLAKLERQVDLLRGEIAAYERVMGALGHAWTSETVGRRTRKRRGLSEAWQQILAWIGDQSRAPTTEEIWEHVDWLEGAEIQRPTLRSQLSIYTRQGLLKRDGSGYILTNAGRLAAANAIARIEGGKKSSQEVALADDR